MRHDEFRVQRDRLLETFPGARKQLRTKESPIVSRLQQSLISGQARLVLHERRGRSGKRHFQRGRDGLGDFVLHVEQVRHLAVIALRPEVIAVARVDELRGDAEARPGSPHAAFENGGDAQRVGDLANVLGLALEREGRRARGHLQPRDLRQEIDDLLGQAVAEVLVVLVRAHVGERQHGDGGLRVVRRRGGAVPVCDAFPRSSRSSAMVW